MNRSDSGAVTRTDDDSRRHVSLFPLRPRKERHALPLMYSCHRCKRELKFSRVDSMTLAKSGTPPKLRVSFHCECSPGVQVDGLVDFDLGAYERLVAPFPGFHFPYRAAGAGPAYSFQDKKLELACATFAAECLHLIDVPDFLERCNDK